MKRTFFISALIAVAAMILVAAPAPASARAEDKPTVVVELFTSQGCMACPPADKVLAALNQDDANVIALSWPVDYWDYLGWQDTFATPENSNRQASYNWSMGRKGVYTPQMVFNGRRQVVGSRKGEVQAMVQDLRSSGAMPVDVSLQGDGSNLSVRLQGDNLDEDTTILLIMFNSEHVVDIRYGENEGRTLRYANVVRHASSLGAYSGGDVTIPVDMTKIEAEGVDCIAVIVQSGKGGPILGAVKTTLAELGRN